MSAKVDIIVCEKVIISEDNGISKPAIVSPLAELCPIAIPSNYTFQVICTLTEFDLNIASTMKLAIKDPMGKSIFESPNIETPTIGKANPPLTDFLQFIFELVNMELYYEGIYKITVTIDGDLVSTSDLPVIDRRNV